MTIIIDRIEGDLAVAELCGQTVELPVALLPEGVREGSVLTLTATLTTSTTDEAEARLERLRQTGPAGDTIDL